jgi:hypothetical protein
MTSVILERLYQPGDLVGQNALPAKPPETLRAEAVYRDVAILRRYRELVNAEWFTLPYEVRTCFKAFPLLDFPAAVARLSIPAKLTITARAMWHLVRRDEAYFTALREHYQEAGRLAEAIQRRIEEEKTLQIRVAEEARESGEWPENVNCDEPQLGLNAAYIRQRREARKSRATS